MAFDCMAIGVGLFASVMATWEPNERFTYGYVVRSTCRAFCHCSFQLWPYRNIIGIRKRHFSHIDLDIHRV